MNAALLYVKTDGSDANTGADWAHPKKTITAAMNAASTGTIIYVASGYYDEHVTVKVGVQVYGGFPSTGSPVFNDRSWRVNPTTLSASTPGPVVSFEAGAQRSTVLEGFTILGGVYNGAVGGGGAGIQCINASPTIGYNFIFQCALPDGSPGNYYGAGIFVSSGSPLIYCCMIGLNDAKQGFGGGVACINGGSPVLTNNTIAYNNGGGVYLKDCTVSFRNNIISGSISGSGLTIAGSASITKNNNLYWQNSPTDIVNGFFGPTEKKQDPLYLNAGGFDLRIRANSPCYNAGDSSAIVYAQFDAWAQTRLKGGIVDIGGAESQNTRWYVASDMDDANNGYAWGTAKKTLKAAMIAASYGDVVCVKAGTYSEYLDDVKNGIAFYGGFNGTEVNLDARDWKNNLTILDGANNKSIAKFISGQDSTTRMDGFTMQNCIGIFNGVRIGGAISIAQQNTSPVIANCTFKNNSAGFSSSTGGEGGAVWISSHSSPTVINCTFLNNISSYGGALYVGNSSARIESNIFKNNTGYVGGSVFITNGETLQNGTCTFVNNLVTGSNGSSWAVDAFISPANIINNTIAYNNSRGLRCYVTYNIDQGQFRVFNNIVAFNAQEGLTWYPGAFSDFKNNCVYGNGLDYDGGSAPASDVHLDPQFYDSAAGNFALKGYSPCIDKGLSAVVPVGVNFDLAGVSRFQGKSVDIGAYETTPASNLNDIKNFSDGAGVSLSGVRVTAVVPNAVYVESNDRSSGIRVEGAISGLTAPSDAYITGTIQTNSHGERYIQAASVSRTNASPLEPLTMNLKNIVSEGKNYNPISGVGQKGFTNGVGLNTVGLYVRFTGWTTDQNYPWTTPSYAIMKDANGERVRISSMNNLFLTEGSLLRITGPVSMLTENGTTMPNIWVTNLEYPAQ